MLGLHPISRYPEQMGPSVIRAARDLSRSWMLLQLSNWATIWHTQVSYLHVP